MTTFTFAIGLIPYVGVSIFAIILPPTLQASQPVLRSLSPSSAWIFHYNSFFFASGPWLLAFPFFLTAFFPRFAGTHHFSWWAVGRVWPPPSRGVAEMPERTLAVASGRRKRGSRDSCQYRTASAPLHLAFGMPVYE